MATPDLLALAGLFSVAFVAATLLPAQSEAAFVALLLAGRQSPALLLLAATTGNVLGSVVNWWIGRGIEHFKGRRWFPMGEAQLERAGRWYRRYGAWSLLLSWAPVVGDAITVVAGVLREPLAPFLALVTAAKLGRYLVVMALVSHWL
jgi:membrane protein YqaA with SNARE-associated domain